MYTEFLTPIYISIQVTFIASLLAFTVAVAAAGMMKRKHFRGKNIVETIFMLPLVLPPTVIGFGLLYMFGRNSAIGQMYERIFHDSIVFSFWAAVIAATVVAFPLMYQTLKAGFEQVDRELEEVAKVLGGNSLQVFRYVTLPLSKNVLLVGIVLGAARALGEFGATMMFAGNIPGRTQTVPTAIYVAVEMGKTELALYWVISIIILSFFMLYFVRRSSSS
ncbi:molybdate ABC transporter permease subunit [Bacillus shivajii]|uniref:molybdate ABC transporter permease subunit n=1 Tax=Bacillus shivajii TaxID=1983719 RepID=UPI001CFC08DD|nr:molybdate ABC transporter permease subunit [Bacillus shivajii]UCZ54188.1 molybdate ABC transporter permease subunit [Bacillus shivajii]